MLYKSVTCLLVSLKVSFAEQMFLILTKSNSSIISFMSHDVAYNQSSPYPGPSRFSPVSSCRDFLVLHSAFRYVIHFELVFEGCVDSFLLLTRGCPAAAASCAEKTSFAPLHCCCHLC